VFLRWLRRHPVAVITTILVILTLGCLTEGGHEVRFCPLCGQTSVEEGFRIVGIRLTASRDDSDPCLLPAHRFILSGASWGNRCTSGYTHISGWAGQWAFQHKLALGPWISARAPSDPDRMRVLAAIDRAGFEQLRELFRDGSFLMWEGSGGHLEAPNARVLDRWAEEVLLPWASRVPPDEDR
jgi:hypothetical protein